jgi:peptide/nickel transport system ATP-binding protein
VGLARQTSDRIAVLYRGKLVEQGSTAQVLDDPQHDYTKALLAAVPGVRVG